MLTMSMMIGMDLLMEGIYSLLCPFRQLDKRYYTKDN